MLDSGTTPDVGQRIRDLREKQGLSLREVAARSGLSINAISRIERGDNSPTVASLHLIAQALGVSITEFFTQAEAQSVIYVKPSEQSQRKDGTAYTESLGYGLVDQQLAPFLVTVMPDERPKQPITHAGQEFVYCLNGRVDYQINDTIYVLEAGYSLLFEASQPHTFWNPSLAPAQLLFVFQAVTGFQHHNDP